MNTKIIVIRMREIIYTVILLFLVTLLILCLVLMFSPNSGTSGSRTDSPASETGLQSLADASETLSGSTAISAAIPESGAFLPGIYTAPVQIGSASFEVEVTVDQTHINSVRFLHLNRDAGESFPLLAPSIAALEEQILAKQKLDGITSSIENRYTSQLLLSAISSALNRARADG